MRTILNKQTTILLFLIFSILNIFGQNSTGLIPIQTFGTKDYNAQPQNWAFAEDKNGVIYVGNKESLLVYTGSWKQYRLKYSGDVRSLDIGEDGRIFVGGMGEFGYFYIDSNNIGTLEYHPIFQLLDSNKVSEIGTIIETFAINSKAYFVGNKKLYIYSDNKLETITPPGRIIFAAYFNNKLLIKIKEKGLFTFTNNEFIPLNIESKELATEFRYITNYDDNTLILISKEHQLIKLELSNNTTKQSQFHTQLDSLLKEVRANKILNINNKYFGISIFGKGLYIIDKNGKFIRKIDSKTGLIDDVFEKMFLDSQNNLWIAHGGGGISRIAIMSNYEYFPPEITGFKGKIQAITRYNGKLYFGTDIMHLYELDEYSNRTKSILTKSQIDKKCFTKSRSTDIKESSNNGCWDILNVDIDNNKFMLFITNDYIFQLNDIGDVDTAYHMSGNVILQDEMDPHRVWIGLYPKGLASMYYQDGKWIDEGMVSGINIDIKALEFDNSLNLWLGRKDAISMLKKPVFTNHKIVKPEVVDYNEKNGLPHNDAIYPMNNEDKMIFASGEGLFLFNEKEEQFSRTDIFTDWYKNHFVFRMINDSYNNIWTVTYPLDKSKIFLKKLIINNEGKYEVVTPYAQEKTAQAFITLYQDGNTLWAGGTFDLVKINNINEPENPGEIISFINKIIINNKDTLFDGFFYNEDNHITKTQDKSLYPVLPYSNRNLTFYFSAIAEKLEAKPNYRWKLDGYDSDWEDWTTKNEVRYTNLQEGDYSFILQSKDIYGNISKEVSYSFSVRPPWHRTIWAYIAYLLFFIAFVWGAIEFSTRSLKKIIREATAEIRAQKDDIEEKNQDIMSSIRYAQRIQEAVSPQKKQMDKVFPEHFVLWKPRDIVSGDFYWMMQKEGKAIIAAADCTGHGVPGAFMSIMGISFLNEIANNKDVKTGAEALNQLRTNVITSLNQEGSETDTKDGMDISLCVYDFDNMMMQFAGAYNPLYMIRDGELSIIKADRMPIGVHDRDKNSFTNMEFSMHKGDMYYILSDGYIDQFGGPKGKKFMTKRFKQLILDIHTKPMEEQKEILWQTILEWRGEIEQIDDIIIIGIKV